MIADPSNLGNFMIADTSRPVLVDNIARSAIFVGQPTLEPMFDAGSRAVHSYPLLASPDDVVGVLSFHYREREPEPGAVEPVVHSAAQWSRRCRRMRSGSAPSIISWPKQAASSMSGERRRAQRS